MPDFSQVFAVILLDRSASMGEGDKKVKAEGSIKSFIEEQANGPGSMLMSLYDFNSGKYSYGNGEFGWENTRNVWNRNKIGYSIPPWRKVFGPTDIKTAKNIHYILQPAGGTSLRDSMSAVIDDVGVYLRHIPEENRPGRVVFETITDGEENSSVLVSSMQLKEKIEEQTRKYSWDFVFIGAGLDAFAVGNEYGIQTNIQYAGTGASYAAASAGLSQALLASRTTGQSVNSAVRYLGNVYDEQGNASTKQ